jgi:hypothetical protein
VGAIEVVTVKGVLLVAEPPGAVTETGPVVAPVGTTVTISVGLDDATVAATPLKVTVFWLLVALKPVPLMVTDAPTCPLLGLNWMIDTWFELCREIDWRLPTAS